MKGIRLAFACSLMLDFTSKYVQCTTFMQHNFVMYVHERMYIVSTE